MNGVKFGPKMASVNIVPLWNYVDKDGNLPLTWPMPLTRMNELYSLAEEHNGLLSSAEARALGIKDSVLVRLAQRSRLERMSRGVYRFKRRALPTLGRFTCQPIGKANYSVSLTAFGPSSELVRREE